MIVQIDYAKEKDKILFSDLRDKECFFGSGVLYMKISEQDLKEYKINSVNAISILNAGLTYFQPDEEVYKAIRIVEKKR